MIRNFLEPVPNLDGKSILITGGTGSFGKAFVRTVLQRYKPARLVIFSRDELKQYEMNQELSDQEFPCLRYFIGDVRDQARLEMAMAGIEYVVHAAALKHVPIAEYNPFECVQTNIIGAENVVRAALNKGVRKIVALSTDKAANPINLYGASKLASDKIFIAANNIAGASGLRSSVVRYGNVMGSRGSVLPFFRKLVANKVDRIPITHPEMTRFWITLEQGINMVLSSFDLMNGGEIFVPKIPSMKVVDLANAIAPGIPHEIVGIRPGEKLHEVMVTGDDARMTVDLGDRYAILPSFRFWTADEGASTGVKRVPNNFNYSSDINDEWLDVIGFNELVAHTGI
ncbi:UDP-N-acetylglucosamine 4,6-dehydratase (inverting) [Mesorhizobium sp. NPDC059054]|uniref:UDP-N-acetylglucosamine 4,6-dehydratase (inverting) n=1 Tax=Mesorhizobium sp. NPDC059054 TaxID=3346711 RepID=UPI0036C6BB35